MDMQFCNAEGKPLNNTQLLARFKGEKLEDILLKRDGPPPAPVIVVPEPVVIPAMANLLDAFTHPTLEKKSRLLNLRIAVDVLGLRMMKEAQDERHGGLQLMQSLRHGLYAQMRELMPDLPPAARIMNRTPVAELTAVQAMIDAEPDFDAKSLLLGFKLMHPMSIQHHIAFRLETAGTIDEKQLEAAEQHQPEVSSDEMRQRFQVQADRAKARLRPKLAPVLGIIETLKTDPLPAAAFDKLHRDQQVELYERMDNRLFNELGAATKNRAPTLLSIQTTYTWFHKAYLALKAANTAAQDTEAKAAEKVLLDALEAAAKPAAQPA